MGPDPPSYAIHASAETAAAEDSRYIRDAVDGRLRLAPGQDSRPVVWAQGLSGWGLTARDGAAGRLDRSTDGVLGGVDIGLSGGWRAGLLAAQERTSLSTRWTPASGLVDSDHLGAYAGGDVGALRVSLGGAYAWRQLDMDRPAGGGSPWPATSRYDAGLLQGFGEVSYRLPTGPAVTEPFLGGAFVFQTAQPFVENGGASGQPDGPQVGLVMTGLRETLSFNVQGARAQLTGAVGWRGAFGRLGSDVLGGPGGWGLIEAPGDAVAKRAATLEGGVGLVVSRRVTLDLTYDGQIGATLDSVAVRAGVHIGF